MYEQNENDLTFYGYHLKGLEPLDKVFCKIIADKKFVSVYAGDDLRWQLEIKYVKTITVDQELKDKKSTCGRAIIGGLLTGAWWGAMLGALSAELCSIDMLISSIETEDELIIFEST
jgi:hypothetical protein